MGRGGLPSIMLRRPEREIPFFCSESWFAFVSALVKFMTFHSLLAGSLAADEASFSSASVGSLIRPAQHERYRCPQARQYIEPEGL